MILGIERRWWPLILLGLLGLFLYLLQPILTPFLMASAIAYLGDPLTDQLEERGFSRTMSVTLVFVAFGLLGLLVLLIALPLLLDQLQLLIEKLRLLYQWFLSTGLPALREYAGVAPLEGDEPGSMAARLTESMQRAGGLVVQLSQQIIGSGLTLTTWAINFALVPVVTFYLLRDWDLLVAWIDRHLPRRVQPKVAELASECDEVLSAFVRGQLLVMASLGLIYATGLWLIGLDLAFIVGGVAGLASIVPYLGSIVGVGAALIAGWAQFGDVWMMVWILLVFGVGQGLEGMVLTPLLVGERIGLHPVAVIFAVMAGGQLFGFTGILMALPVAAVVKVLVGHALERYRESAVYVELPPGVIAAPPKDTADDAEAGKDPAD